MDDRGSETKPEEHYPLLKVDGRGDMGVPQPATLSPPCGVTCSQNKTRWPELMSACWMTLILFGISFVLFYALGTSVYRRQQFNIVKCHSSRPGSHVFHYEIVPRSESPPFLRQAEWLSEAAALYPRLHFNVFYLQDDTYAPRPKGRLMNKLFPFHPYGSYKTEYDYQQAVVAFRRKYQNVNVTVMPLSKFMSMTPLRCKWRAMPSSYLPFYARLYSLWEHGGVGVDLAASPLVASDRRLNTILKLHNDGISTADYGNARDNNEDEGSAVIAIVFSFMNRFLNDTCALINRTLSFPSETHEPDVLMRSQEVKRDVPNDSLVIVTETEQRKSPNEDIQKISNAMLELPLFDQNETLSLNISNNVANKSDEARMVVFYDFQIMSDGIGPRYQKLVPLLSALAPTAIRQAESKVLKQAETDPGAGPPNSYKLAIDAEGSFVASFARAHPFLGHILSAACHRISPKLAIQDAFLTQCAGIMRDGPYCNNIYIL